MPLRRHDRLRRRAVAVSPAVIALAAALCALLLSSMIGSLLLRGADRLPGDRSNHRSMHRGTVPRGGGLMFVSATLVVYPAASVAAGLPTHWMLLSVFAVMAVIGWLDDRAGLGIRPRLIVQTALAALAATVLLSRVPGFADALLPAAALWLIAVSVIVWGTNLFNFMDGMDGLAASQAAVVLGTLAWWLWRAGALGVSLLALVAAASVLAFLRYNRHPARVFMGDTGSLSLGVLITVISLAAVFEYSIPAVAVIALMGLFLFDATVTLVRRIVGGERWWEPHRSHYYQRAAALGYSQVQVVSTMFLLNVLLVAASSRLVLTGDGAVPALAVLAAVTGVPALWLEYRERCGRETG